MAKKASVTIQGVEAANKKISELIEKIGKSEELYTFIGDNVKTQITNRTKTNKESYKQPSLQPVSIEARKLLEQAGNSTGKGFGPRKSNLTMTGQLLDSIAYKINLLSGEIRLFLNDTRTKLKLPSKDLISGKRPKGGWKKETFIAYNMLLKTEQNKTNNQIKDDLESKGRKFFFISQDVITQVENQLTRWFKKEKANLIKKYLKK